MDRLSALRGVVLASAVTAGLLAAVPAPAADVPDFPVLSSPAAVRQACDQGLAEARAQLAALERRPADAGWLAASDALSATIEDRYYPIGFLSNVHPQAAVRAATQACELRWQGFLSTLGLNERLYQALKSLPPGDAIDQRAASLAMEAFEDSGVALPPAQRPQAKRLADRIGELGLAFDKAVRDGRTRVAFTEAELKGVPEATWRGARRDAQRRILLGLDMPSYLAVMNNAESAAARERMYRAKMTEGGPANLERLSQIVRLRTEYAALFGHASYDDFVLRRRMTGGTERTQAFLDEVKAAVTASELRDVEELRQAKAEHTGQPLADTRIQRWDVFFYGERVRRQRYSIDQEAFRPYFPPQESVQFVMKLAERMFGVRHERIQGARLWHPEAQAWAVVDADSGQRLSTLLIDLYPRDGKYNHAAVWPLRSVSTASGRLPMSALVVNLDRKGLSLEEVETLLHEFGHALHNNLSRTRYTAQAGTSVLQDFVEAPSQMLEDWVYDPEVLGLMQQVCADCKPVPREMLAQARRARDHGKGLTYSRQHLYASYDLALYGPRPAGQPVDPLALWVAMEGATPVGHVQGTMLPAGFGHIAGGYAAGYYGYLYSLVVAMDLRTAFEGRRLDAAVGKRYRDSVLAQGGQKPPLELVRDFLGRDTNSKAFFDYLAE
ncbi:M3 family metallopeptidase [Aquincola sp. J276]|uniref:M3 family metallopeptidase n=1 Tax=Aquincola sp. J276 TaxID=2898432 RepID=UPI0021512305|nr:M3 family metallopeptidase [Aquincola sp. J276]MCR5864870.1 Zn-dependent oligopeptidase [Aquincola sp. J276]